MKFTLHKAAAKDWKEIADMESKVASLFFRPFANKKDYLAYVKKSRVYFIVVEGEKAGIISYEPNDGYDKIDSLIILQEFRGKGLAGEALKIILEEIGKKRVELVAHPGNTPALVRYLKSGFVIKEWKKNHFGDGEPRILLVKE